LLAEHVYASEVSVHHYFGHNLYQHHGVLEFAWASLSLKPYRDAFLTKHRQQRFNATKTFETDRILILRKILDLEISTANHRWYVYRQANLSTGDLYTSIHGQLAWAHPNHDVEINRFDRILESLIASGDLEQDNGNFKTTGKALATIQEADQRSRDEVQRQSLSKQMNTLTLLIFLATAIQAGSALFSSLDGGDHGDHTHATNSSSGVPSN
jgi:hypothetical protein